MSPSSLVQLVHGFIAAVHVHCHNLRATAHMCLALNNSNFAYLLECSISTGLQRSRWLTDQFHITRLTNRMMSKLHHMLTERKSEALLPWQVAYRYRPPPQNRHIQHFCALLAVDPQAAEQFHALQVSRGFWGLCLQLACK